MADNGLDFYKKQAVAKPQPMRAPLSSFETEDEWTSRTLSKRRMSQCNWPKEFGTFIHARLEALWAAGNPCRGRDGGMLPEGPEVPMASIINPTLDVINEFNLQFQSTSAS
jgi:hypothetical protein